MAGPAVIMYDIGNEIDSVEVVNGLDEGLMFDAIA